MAAFTTRQIPGIDRRTYSPELAGARYPAGIPIHPEAELEDLLRVHHVDEVVLAYSDLSHVEVMRRASRVLPAGAHPPSEAARQLPSMAVQRFGSLADIDGASPTIEEREEYERPVEEGFVLDAGVDYAAIVARAELEADVTITVADPLRPGHELTYHPGETNLRRADIVVLGRTDTIAAGGPDVVVLGTSMDLARIADLGALVRRARYEYADAGTPTLAQALEPWLARWAATDRPPGEPGTTWPSPHRDGGRVVTAGRAR